ncbi:MAG: YihY/virulence factor BrkB family protein [Dehalococcoidia bacterium]
MPAHSAGQAVPIEPPTADAASPSAPARWAGVGRWRPVRILAGAGGHWAARGAPQHAGALAFYTLFSMAPLMIILIAIIGAVFGQEAARGEIAARLSNLVGPRAAELVQDAVGRSRVETAGLLPTLLGFGALLVGSTTVFAQLQSSLNTFWGVTAKPSRSGIVVFLTTRLESLGLVLVIGLLLLVSLVLSTGVAATLQFAGELVPVPGPVVAGVDVLVSLVGATLLFAMIFKILPDVHLQWRDMWLGAFVTAVLFVIGRIGISLYLTRTAPDSTYGAAGSLVILLLWVYYSSLILFFGAAVTRAVIRDRGDRILPKPTAVRVHWRVLEEQAEQADQAEQAR